MKPKFKNEYSIGTRIKECREGLNLSRNFVCEKLDGLALSTLQKWENNEREPSAGMIIKLSQILQTTPTYLLTGDDPVGALIYVNRNGTDDNLIDIPEYDVNVSAGNGSFNEGLFAPTNLITFSKEWLKRMHIYEKKLAIFWASGDSMSPTIENGDMLLVDLNNKHLREGGIFIVQNSDSMWVKRVREDWNAIELLSDNTIYKPIRINAEDAEHLQIVGRVIHIGHKI
ncbi:helix-turn-helix transcriptional regulator [Pasteurella multocida]|uniref:XRE family transcriptional regulator n=1 Tax=Pasteurella multocida TaxID=747 RepID=UPI000353CDF7|nr:helix-turn-helix transcriptional regulator [Pasteurella multocida]EPE67415.1 transcriptional regulator [Pasteurella multocida P1933]ESQ72749.1 transcriptional regulator [Pasteurella multocida subsp. multocida P1062]MCL7838805.1 helix-turn-helix transcriptional regulator [Pasteurella multocida]MCL7842530.1 helix-turn-helix transcriptional regulator [Pasteurella multocida]MDY0618020.1 helix-turn-helix transcriptional regulator [Pasteurella multocida]